MGRKYDRSNYLRRVARVQEETWAHKQRGATYTWIYRNIIKDKYNISKSTFDKYIGMRIKSELERLEQNK